MGIGLGFQPQNKTSAAGSVPQDTLCALTGREGDDEGQG